MTEKPIDKLEVRKRITSTLAEIDEIAKPAMAIFDGSSSVGEEITVAFAMRDILEMLTVEVMAPIKSLANTSLGFKTDRDPAVWNKNKNAYNEPYPDDVIKRCFAESRLRGLHVIGGEWAILVGSCFPCQPGLERKVRELTKGTFECSNDAPIFGPKQAVIRFRGKWSLGREEFNIGIRPEDVCEFSVNVYEGTMPAAVVGKGYRMLLARVLKRITGRNVLSDAEVSGEAIEVESKVVKPSGPSFGPVEPVGGVKGSNDLLTLELPERTPENSVATASTVVAPLNPEPSGGTKERPAASDAPRGPVPETKAVELETAILDAGYKQGQFLAWLQESGRLPNGSSFGCIAEIPEALAASLIRDTKAIGKFFKAYPVLAK